MMATVPKQRVTTMDLKSNLVFALGSGQWTPQHEAGWKVLSSGPDERLRNAVVDVIDRAKDTLFVCSFIVADTKVQRALLAAVDRHVRVYLLTAAALKLKPGGDEDEEWTRDDDIREGHKQMLNAFTERIFLRSAGHYHAKYVIADGSSGILTTCNLTTKAMLESPELGVMLDEVTCKDLVSTFRYQFWEKAEQELIRMDMLDNAQPEGRFDEPTPSDEARLRCTYMTDQRSGLLDEVLGLINEAQRSVMVTSYGWGHPEVMQALKQRAAAGVEVRVLGRNHRGPGHTNPMLDLAEGGCNVRGIRNIHAKSVLIDAGSPRARGLVMSANVDKVSLGTSHDVGVVIVGEDTVALSSILEGWWTAGHRLLTKQERASVVGKISHFEDGWSTLLVLPDDDIDHGELVAPSAHEMEKVEPDKVTLPKGQLQRALTERWTVVAPRLPPGSKQEAWRTAPSTRTAKDGEEQEVPGVAHDHPVFVTPEGERVIAVKTLDDAKKAASYLKTARAKRVVLT